MRLIRDTLIYCNDGKLAVAVTDLNVEKAYNRVAHEFLFGVLSRMGMLEPFIGWVKLYIITQHVNS